MKNLSVLLMFLSLLFLVIPIIQQMIKVNQENKLALTTDLIGETDVSSSEYDDTDIEDLDVCFDSKTVFYLHDNESSKNSNIAISNPCRRELESPPPKA
ncbi:hypothetical protein QUH73_02555 [Labilibaculum sp. K2S]|uniref:hypothetical protein n=1 Tax=Labilibaculum sp. K2S TaxID=3056386 RepID=UPI0025A49DF8|nr:hypothetical protein [Labilibaculum sp. K2S]MDM8158691.1 hypothetical protein [Labilibaculum sp. K2S]